MSLGVACTVAGPPPEALYPNAETIRLPSSQVANISGPIAKIDDRDVSTLGGWFDLLPGCHVVELQRRSANNAYVLSTGITWGGQLPITLYALRMKAGARYTITQNLIPAQNGRGFRVVRSAREELPGGATADLDPVESRNDILACRDWEATLPR